MTRNSKPYLTRFGIRIDANNPFLTSKFGIFLLIALHWGAICILWVLPFPYSICWMGSLLMVCSTFQTLNRCIFSLANYQINFFFQDKHSWMIQEGTNTCYRGALQSAFCTNYLVILVFKQMDPPVHDRGFRKLTLILPIFFDSLPHREFRQLRKVLILSSYA